MTGEHEEEVGLDHLDGLGIEEGPAKVEPELDVGGVRGPFLFAGGGLRPHQVGELLIRDIFGPARWRNGLDASEDADENTPRVRVCVEIGAEGSIFINKVGLAHGIFGQSSGKVASLSAFQDKEEKVDEK